MTSKNPWNDENTQQLIELWNSGLSASQVGARLGFNKNQIIGKAHRTPECILKSNPITSRPPAKPRVKNPFTPKVTIAAVREAKPLPLPPITLKSTCQWIEGDPKTKPVRWCGQPNVEKKSWCPDHYRVVFSKPPAQLY